MTLTFISTEQCINHLQRYATTEKRSWNPFTLFRKRKLKNHSVASDIATILEKTSLSDKELLSIAKAIKSFEDEQLQQDLLSFLYRKINIDQQDFITKRQNIQRINELLQDILNKKYRPWWTLFLIEMPYYSYSFRSNLMWLIENISHLFTKRREEVKQNLLDEYSNEEVVNQFITEYQNLSHSQDTEKETELSKLIDISLDQTIDHTRAELIKEIKKSLIDNIPFGKVLISATVLSSIINSYLSQQENQTKARAVQAQEILYIIGKIFLKANASQLVKPFIPGVSEIVDAVVSIVVSKPSLNPLHTDQKIGTAIASATGGTVGGAIGTMIPLIGTYLGAYVGAVVSKTAATRFYQVLEAWQKAPNGPGSIIPRYPRSFLALIDNDAKNILEPLYKNYLETERKSKKLGDEIAKWLCIYTLVQNSSDKDSEEYLEIIKEEMNRLKSEFMSLKNIHGSTALFLYDKQPDNPARVKEYISKVKVCLQPLHQPIIGILNAYFLPTLRIDPMPTAASYVPLFQDSPTATFPAASKPLNFFDHRLAEVTTSSPPILPGEEVINNPSLRATAP
ncbi:hypothetical protein [Legionella sp. km772]|uniref:hypothetical protein n=1 Tax=Legionella sp. km772 TaxID=2498111 RepID=UPI000F8F4E4B|nr:hypothetical protein [Legionella sp. km772]RUR07805.1 hypothetical protein ELY15_11825 [Legionella sp. km772]